MREPSVHAEEHPRDVNEDLARWLLASADADAAPFAGAEIYRRIVRANLDKVIANALPVTAELLGDGFPALLREFYAAGGPKTPFYREIPGDLVAWAAGVDHPLADLLHFEWLELLAARHPAELDGLRPPPPGVFAINPTIQASAYDRPVHTMGPDNPSPAPYPTPMVLLVWRRPSTDATERYAVGLLLARILGLAAASPEPLHADVLAAQLAADAGLSLEEARAKLGSLEVALREREGLLSRPEGP